MHDHRTSTALRQLTDLGGELDPPRWAWAVVRLDAKGRVLLSPDARSALGVRLGDRTEVVGRCHRVAMVLQRDGGGAPMVVDGRGHLRVPAWLRRGPGASMVVGTRYDAPVVVVAPATVLDGLGDVLAGSSR